MVTQCGDRIGLEIDHQAKGITRRPAARKRQHDIRSVAHTPGAERLAEVLFVFFDAEFRGDIPETEDAQRGVDTVPGRYR